MATATVVVDGAIALSPDSMAAAFLRRNKTYFRTSKMDTSLSASAQSFVSALQRFRFR
jgi:hypothetical protein